MAVDISSLTQLINTFKQETREETVTVEVLGSLLQKIVDILGTTALRKILASPEPIDLKLWTRSGKIQSCTAASPSNMTSTKAQDE